MFSARLLAPVAVLLFAACDPASLENGVDPTAVFDQKPMRSQGWKVEGQSSNTGLGLTLTTAPTAQRDGVSQQELLLPDAKITKTIQALTNNDVGTANLIFSV